MEKDKILYVDDEIINLQLFEINLSKKYSIFLAEDGLKGLEVLNHNPDIKVVISDMRMPKMDGLEFIRTAKQQFHEIKYFILTGYDITDEIEEALNSGLITNCFRKPFNMNEIKIEIQKVL